MVADFTARAPEFARRSMYSDRNVRVSAGLLRAYRGTRYETAGAVIWVGRRFAAMDQVLAGLGAHEGVFITAWNPRSRRMQEAWNRRMQRQLDSRLRSIPKRTACGRLGRWWEEHIFAGVDIRRAKILARQFRQNGLVVVRTGQPARLLILPYN